MGDNRADVLPRAGRAVLAAFSKEVAFTPCPTGREGRQYCRLREARPPGPGRTAAWCHHQTLTFQLPRPWPPHCWADRQVQAALMLTVTTAGTEALPIPDPSTLEVRLQSRDSGRQSCCLSVTTAA